METVTSKKETAKEVNAILKELIYQLSLFKKEQINVVPFKGSWTAGELAQHMIMSNGGFAELLHGPVKETRRDPGERIDDIRKAFLDFNVKFKSPDFINPPKGEYHQEQVICTLETTRERINQAIETLEPSKTCVAFEVPVLGFLTRLEAAHFILCHTMRHVHQLKNIRQALNG